MTCLRLNPTPIRAAPSRTLVAAPDRQRQRPHPELFGPVFTMQTFSTVGEATAAANDSEYGLSASVFSTNNDVTL